MDEFGMGSFTLNREGFAAKQHYRFCARLLDFRKVLAARTPATPPKLLAAAAAAALQLWPML